MGLLDAIDVVSPAVKIKRVDFLKVGPLPIVSQEAGLVNGWWHRPEDRVKVTSPLIVFGDHTKQVKYVDFDFVAGADGIKILRPRPFLDPRYFYHFLRWLPLPSLGYARHFRLLKDQRIRIPPLDEQRTIAARLDASLDIVDTLQAKAMRILVAGNDLARSHIEASIGGNRQPPDREMLLAEATTHITDGDHQPPPKAAQGIPFITIANIDKETHQIDFSSTFSVPLEYYNELKEYRRARRGDILYTVTGSFGIPVLVEDDVAFCFQRHIALIRPTEAILPRWLFYVLQGRKVHAQAQAAATGAAQKTVSLSSLRGFRIPVVPLPEQRQAVAAIDAVLELKQALEESHRRKLTELTCLRRAILDDVFLGGV